MKRQAFLFPGLLGLLVVGQTAVAQDSNPNSPAYHAIHNAQSPYYQGPGSAQEAARPQPSGYWEKTCGAIAPSPKGGVLGTALGASSKQEAERRALADCNAKGGGGCKISISYRNQCAVMILGQTKYFTASAASLEEATSDGIQRCEAGDTSCQVYYSACTEPVFHRY